MIDWRTIGVENGIVLTEAWYYILLAVRCPKHGYGIIQEVADITCGRVSLGPGTLYGAINSMLTKGWVRLYSEDKTSRKKKEYVITETGKEIFGREVDRLQEMLDNAKRMGEGE
ncbi:PadR family transcriptional regulator [Lactonifactor longoviformis]|uniref:PadR family transcriptional regulator n=1 Tax=Lactonifactor longoviformis TaxID=341220 RepID=UPI000934CCF0|nr:PadR family transcriptional regulator [Lactonifactor longoviformis]